MSDSTSVYTPTRAPEWLLTEATGDKRRQPYTHARSSVSPDTPAIKADTLLLSGLTGQP
jgi:hypothetical protein